MLRAPAHDVPAEFHSNYHPLETLITHSRERMWSFSLHPGPQLRISYILITNKVQLVDIMFLPVPCAPYTTHALLCASFTRLPKN